MTNAQERLYDGGWSDAGWCRAPLTDDPDYMRGWNDRKAGA